MFKKSESKGYSYAVFSLRAGIKSPNYLKLVTEGTRTVTNDNILGFAKALGLKDLETIYWENLVTFNQCKTEEQRRHYFVKLIQSPVPASSAEGDKIRNIRDEWEYLSSWHPAAIRELALRADFNEEPATISKLLKGRISTQQAKDALQLLLRLKFLVRNESGKLEQAERTVRYFSEQDLRNLSVRQFHRSTGQLALTCLDEDAPQDRDFSGVTLSIHADAMPALKKKFTEFRKSVLEEFGGAGATGQVLQINFQVIPLTEKKVQ